MPEESFDKKRMTLLETVSIVSARDRRPYVQLRRNGQTIAQMDLETARLFALTILEAAEAGEQDALLWDHLEKMDLAGEAIGNFIADIREKRTELRRTRYGLIQ